MGKLKSHKGLGSLPRKRYAIGGDCQGPRASSRDSATESKISSSKGRPMSWTPMGKPPEESEIGTERPGRPARLSHCEWRMVSR